MLRKTMADKKVESSAEKALDEHGGMSFVQKLYSLVQKPDNEESRLRSIWWTPDGKGILVSPKGFDQHESKKYFQGTRYFGFSRRLMRNYFDRVNDPESLGVHEYRHRDGMFQKNRPDLLNNIKFNNKRPYRRESEEKSFPSTPSPRLKAASPPQGGNVHSSAKPPLETSIVPTLPGASLMSLPCPLNPPAFATGSSLSRQLSLQRINLSQPSFLHLQAMRQAQEDRRELLYALESQRSMATAGQSLDQFVLFQLLQEESQQRQFQNSLLRVSPQLTASLSRNSNPTIPANLAPLAQPGNPSTEDEALAQYIRDLLRFRRGGL